VAGAATLCGTAVVAQTAADAAVVPAAGSTEVAASPLNLRQVFDAAWSRQPEAMALQARRDATRAKQTAAKAWTPEPAALEVSNRTDRLGSNQGAREVEVGIAVPLWLPGERGRSAALADAEVAAIESRAHAAQLRVAATVRDAWWQWQRARIEVATARAQLDSTRLIAADVARRTKAGDLARADQHQADGAVAGAEAAVAQAEAGLAAARQHLRALTGAAPALSGADDSLAEPDPGASATEIEARAGTEGDANAQRDGLLRCLAARSAVARGRQGQFRVGARLGGVKFDGTLRHGGTVLELLQRSMRFDLGG